MLAEYIALTYFSAQMEIENLPMPGVGPLNPDPPSAEDSASQATRQEEIFGFEVLYSNAYRYCEMV